MNWAYGVTTVTSRLDSLLPRTLESLKRGGFDRPRLFVDGADDPIALSRRFGLEVTVRDPVIQCFGNWILALAELFIRNYKAQRYVLFQDDLVTYPNLRQYLERLPYPERGYCNLFTFMENEAIVSHEPNGWYEAATYPPGPVYHGKKLQGGRGAVALMFDRDATATLLSAPQMSIKATGVSVRRWKRIDGGVVEAMNQAGYREYVHAPSLVQHTGIMSSIRNKFHSPPVARTFRGEDFDALGLLS